MRQRRAGAAHVGQDVELERSHPGGRRRPPTSSRRARAPTLLTSTSRPPKRSLAAATASSHPAAVARSPATPSASGAPGRLELARDGRDAVGVAADDGDARSGACQRLRGRQPDARAAAGDQAATALESQLHRGILAAGRPATRPSTVRAMPELLLVRHGETAWNRERRWQGQHDAAAQPRGQAEAAGSRSAHRRGAARRALLLRPAARERDGGRRSHALTASSRRFDARWREVDVGEWLGLTPEEVQSAYPDGYARWLAGGTGWRAGRDRTPRWPRARSPRLREIAARARRVRPGRSSASRTAA